MLLRGTDFKISEGALTITLGIIYLESYLKPVGRRREREKVFVAVAHSGGSGFSSRVHTTPLSLIAFININTIFSTALKSSLNSSFRLLLCKEYHPSFVCFWDNRHAEKFDGFT